MDSEGPIFSPGDQKVFGPQSDVALTSQRIDVVYLIILSGVSLLGIGCFFIGEWIAGGLMVAVGLCLGGLILRRMVAERQMIRRMRRRHDKGGAL